MKSQTTVKGWQPGIMARQSTVCMLAQFGSGSGKAPVRPSVGETGPPLLFGNRGVDVFDQDACRIDIGGRTQPQVVHAGSLTLHRQSLRVTSVDKNAALLLGAIPIELERVPLGERHRRAIPQLSLATEAQVERGL